MTQSETMKQDNEYASKHTHQNTCAVTRGVALRRDSVSVAPLHETHGVALGGAWSSGA